MLVWVERPGLSLEGNLKGLREDLLLLDAKSIKASAYTSNTVRLNANLASEIRLSE